MAMSKILSGVVLLLLASTASAQQPVAESGAALTALQLIDNLVQAEDAVAGNAFAGVAVLAVRQDSFSALAADGDFYPFTVASDGGIRVHIENGGSGGTSSTDDAAFTVGSGLLTPAGHLADETSPDSVNEGDIGVPRMTLNRIALATIRDNADAPVFGTVTTLTDNMAVPAVGMIGSVLMCYDGATLDLCRTESALTHYLPSAASTNATNVKNAAGNVYGIRFVNTTGTLYYLRMYNLSTTPTCSSATGFVETIPIPASSSGSGIVAFTTAPQAYSTGIGYCFTGGPSSTDNTNAATGVYGSILYR
jgi:hypothetical protein